MLLPIIAFVLFGALFFMKDVLPGKPSQLDLWSTITSTLGFGSLLYGFSTAGNDSWGGAKVLIALAVGLVFIALFIHRQLTMERPFLDLRVFLKTQATAYVTAHVQSDLKALAAKAQAGDQAAQAQLANQTQLTQSLAAKYQRAFTRQALLKLSSH